MDGRDDGVRLGGHAAVEIAGDLALLQLAHARPIGPQACEAEQGTALVRSKPDRHLPAVDRVVLAERGERTRQRFSGPSQRFQWALSTLRMFVVPRSGSS